MKALTAGATCSLPNSTDAVTRRRPFGWVRLAESAASASSTSASTCLARS